MKLQSIQFLRGVAALLVVYEHSMDVQIKYGTTAQQKFFHLDNFGCIGVDLFFVISGFIISFVSNKYMGALQGYKFLTKRFLRINPIYYLATILFFISFILFINATKQSLSGSFKDIGLSIADSILILPTSEHIDSFKPLLIVGWTLSYEWLFYLIFLFLIILKAKRKTFYLLLIIGSLILSGEVLAPRDFRLIFLTNPIMLEFMLGVIICFIYMNFKRIPALLGYICLLVGLACYILMIIYGFNNIWHYLGVLSGELSLSRFLWWGIPSGLIVAGCIILEKNDRLTKLWSNKLSLMIGDASYSIYLLHYAIFYLLIVLYTKIGFFLKADALIWVQVIVAVACAIGFYKLVEAPLLKYLNKPNNIDAKQTLVTKYVIHDEKPIAETV